MVRLSRDPFGELAGAQKCPGLKQRFPDRVLVMTTNHCFGYCEHCTRRWILDKSPIVDTPAKLERVIKYVKSHPLIRDVLLSGGDVLTLDDDAVMRFVNAFAALDQIEVIRVCTRAPVSSPRRMTMALARKLAKCGKVWMNVHINTAEEANIAVKSCRKFIERGIPVSSQTVLLKGVNDTTAKMLAMLRALSKGRIRPYYVFQCDPVEGLERFRVPLKTARKIENECAEAIGGLSLPRFVIDLPNAKRKIPI